MVSYLARNNKLTVRLSDDECQFIQYVRDRIGADSLSDAVRFILDTFRFLLSFELIRMNEVSECYEKWIKAKKRKQ